MTTRGGREVIPTSETLLCDYFLAVRQGSSSVFYPFGTKKNMNTFIQSQKQLKAYP